MTTAAAVSPAMMSGRNQSLRYETSQSGMPNNARCGGGVGSSRATGLAGGVMLSLGNLASISLAHQLGELPVRWVLVATLVLDQVREREGMPRT